MSNTNIIKANLADSVKLKSTVLEDQNLLDLIAKLADVMVSCFKNRGKVLWCGNGGSAADAQHIAAELSGRYYYDREPLNSEALHVNTSYLTAVANDYSYNEIYARYVRAVGEEKDVLVGLSTSGNSANVVRAFEDANKLGLTTIAFTGESGGKLSEIANYTIKIPSNDTPRIQECHLLIGHALCQIIETEIFPKSH